MFSIEFASVKGSLFLLQKAPSILLLSFFLMKWTEVAPSSQDSAKKISFQSTAEGISLLRNCYCWLFVKYVRNTLQDKVFSKAQTQVCPPRGIFPNVLLFSCGLEILIRDTKIRHFLVMFWQLRSSTRIFTRETWKLYLKLSLILFF